MVLSCFEAAPHTVIGSIAQVKEQSKRPFARAPFISRMTGAARLHAPTYDEIKEDRSVTIQAVLVAVMAALSIGFGVEPGYDIPWLFVVNRIVWWGVWVFIVYVLGPTLLHTPETGDELGRLARTTGFAQTPAISLVILNLIPWLDPIVSQVIVGLVVLWWYGAMMLAVRRALDLRSNALAALVVGTWFVYDIVSLFGMLF